MQGLKFMGKSSEWSGFKLETPATYRIRVQGLPDASWSDRLGGIAIRRIEAEDNAPVTMLVGYLTDQAALSGVAKLFILYRGRRRSCPPVCQTCHGKHSFGIHERTWVHTDPSGDRFSRHTGAYDGDFWCPYRSLKFWILDCGLSCSWNA